MGASKEKKSNLWIAAGLLTLAAFIITIYCLLEYRDTLWMVGIAGLFLLVSAFWLFTCIANRQKPEPAPGVGQEQRERMNYEGMKLQGEELIRLVNTFGKGSYAYSKRSAEQLQTLVTQTLEAQKTHEQLMNALIQGQTKTAKFQVKYAQEDTARQIAAFTDNCKQIQQNLAACLDIMNQQNSEPASSSPDNAMVIDSLRDLSRELAHISSSIQALQLQVTAAAQTPVMYAPPQPQPQSAEPAPQEVLKEAAPEPQPVEPEPQEVLEEAAPEPQPVEPEPQEVLEEAAPEPQPVEPEPQEVLEEAAPEPQPVEPEPQEVLEEAAPEPQPVEPEPQEVLEEAAPEPQPVEPEPQKPQADISAAISDDPNKQLSADEIAALFAALG